MNIINNQNNLEVRIAMSSALLNTPECRANSYRTGNLKTALHSAIKDIEAMGDDAAFKIVKTYETGSQDSIKCGEMVNGRYCPRNNF